MTASVEAGRGDCPGYIECQALGKTSCQDCRPSQEAAPGEREALERAADTAQRAIDLLGEARSGYIGGSGPDEAWDTARADLIADLNELRDAALSQGNGSEAVGEPVAWEAAEWQRKAIIALEAIAKLQGPAIELGPAIASGFFEARTLATKGTATADGGRDGR